MRMIIAGTIALCTQLSCTESNKPTVRHATDQPTPLFHTYQIVGDFNGDGTEDTLLERFVSTIDNRNLPKIYIDIPFDSVYALNLPHKPLAYLLDKKGVFDTLIISDDTPHLGLAYLKNEGDLNGDGIDEIGYVINWADFSNLNSYVIYSYIHQRWEELYRFPIYDWQIPPFGDIAALDTFKGLVEKINDDSMIIHVRDKGDVLREIVDDMPYPKLK